MALTLIEPTDLPIWEVANPGDYDDPGAKKTIGWLFEDLVPHEWLNWEYVMVSVWTAYFQDVVNNSYGVQHDVTTGDHGDIVATSLEVTGGPFQVNFVGDVLATTITLTGQAKATAYNYVSDKQVLKRYFIRQEDALGSAALNGTVSVPTTARTQVINLAPLHDCRLLFEVSFV